MGEPYTDRFGWPLTSAQALRRLQSPGSAGYFKNGVWIRRRKKIEPQKGAAVRPVDTDRNA